MQSHQLGHDETTDFLSWLEGLVIDAKLGPSATRVFRTLATSPSFTSKASAAQVAARARVNASTVVRTARTLGFDGWPELQLELKARYLSFLDSNQLLELHERSDATLTRRSLDADIASLKLLEQNLDEERIAAACSALASANNIGLLGSGSYIGPLIQFAHVSSRLGLSTVMIGREGRSVHTALSQLHEGDVLFIINLWRTPKEIETIARAAKDLGITILLISDSRTIKLTETADHHLVCPSEGSSHYPSLSAATSLIHILLSNITHMVGDQGDEAMRHHEYVYEKLEQIRNGSTV